ncbi:MAG: hypothetical protein U0792_05300 [Gemmataceae bacterium]
MLAPSKHLNPLRPLDWRWQRAAHLVRSGRHYAPRRDDPQIGAAMRYQRLWNRTSTENRPAVLARTFPELHRAQELHKQGGNLRAELQARILARQPLDDSAACLGLSVGVVEWFEALFFQVLDRLCYRDWVVLRVIRWWTFDPNKGRDSETLLRAYAYWGGVAALEATLPYLLGNQSQQAPVMDLNTPEGRLDRSIRLSILVDSLPLTGKTDRILPRLGLLLRELDLQQAVRERNVDLANQLDPELLTEKLTAARQQVSSTASKTTQRVENRQTA